MGRADQFNPAQQAELGRAVAVARASGIPWKTIEQIYGRSKWQLRRYLLKDAPSYSEDAPSAELRRDSAVCL